jgi:hypothetical protein
MHGRLRELGRLFMEMRQGASETPERWHRGIVTERYTARMTER